MRRYLRGIRGRGVRASLKRLFIEWAIFLIHLRGLKQAKKYAVRKKLRLNLASGENSKKGWLNIDLKPWADLTLDLREPLPFDSNSCSEVYSEHFLEHLDYPTPAIDFLKDCFRVLEPGGVFSVGVPDTEWPLLEYAGVSKTGYFKTVEELWHPSWCQTELEHINHHFRFFSKHRFAYDFKTLGHALRQAGFMEIVKREFDPTRDNLAREIGTLYVDAIKPRNK